MNPDGGHEEIDWSGQEPGRKVDVHGRDIQPPPPPPPGWNPPEGWDIYRGMVA